MADAHKNFATSLVATAPSPATSGTSLVVTGGEGSRFPTAPFNAVICPAASDATPANAEVVRVTGILTDTFTITRATESSSARTVVVGDRIYAGATAKSLTDIEAVHVTTDTVWDAKGDLAVGTGADTAAALTVGTSLTHRLVADSAATTGLKWVPHVVRRSAASSTKASDTTLGNDDTLLWAIAANEVWFFQAWLVVQSTGQTGDVKFGWSVPASATMIWGGSGIAGAAQPGYGATTTGNAPTAMITAADAFSTATLNGNNGVGLAGVVTNSSTAGNVNLQWAQVTSNAETVRLLANSILILYRLA